VNLAAADSFTPSPTASLTASALVSAGSTAPRLWQPAAVEAFLSAASAPRPKSLQFAEAEVVLASQPVPAVTARIAASGQSVRQRTIDAVFATEASLANADLPDAELVLVPIDLARAGRGSPGLCS
jgi:hypothetical protein